MIDEMMCPLDSPGSVSAAVIVALLFRNSDKCVRGNHRPRNGMCRAGVVRALPGAPNWLAAESVSAAMAAASLSSDNASAMPFLIYGIRAENKLFTRAGDTECHISLPSIRHMCPDTGASWASSGDRATRRAAKT